MTLTETGAAGCAQWVEEGRRPVTVIQFPGGLGQAGVLGPGQARVLQTVDALGAGQRSATIAAA